MLPQFHFFHDGSVGSEVVEGKGAVGAGDRQREGIGKFSPFFLSAGNSNIYF